MFAIVYTACLADTVCIVVAAVVPVLIGTSIMFKILFTDTPRLADTTRAWHEH